MPFQIHALSNREFEDLFEMPEAELEQIGAVRVKADSKPGYPCRVSLQDAEIGDELILLNYVHLPERSPYKASHAIYVRKAATPATLNANEVPQVLSRRILSIRGFGDDHLMKNADVVDGKDLAEELDAFFADPAIAYIHIHNAKQGCFAAKATR
tara:strand:+ start:52 stop:516 length:465 start_codon:yes stop_codon:yes gene_type:complete